MLKQDVRYGGDDSGRLWRAYPKADQPALTVLEVMYPSDMPRYDLWAVMTEEDMIDITDQKGIYWMQSVIEV